jgi:pyruvate/2-oxoglutarate dehydrogenase complex dihydrolipoamide acyltransferase (E2) component
MVNELVAKTLIKNLDAKERIIPWAGVSLKAGESRVVEGLFPTACKTPSDQALMMAEIDANKVEVVLITNLTCAGVDSFAAARAGSGKYAGQLTGQVQRQEISLEKRRQEHIAAEVALLAREAESRSTIPKDPAGVVAAPVTLTESTLPKMAAAEPPAPLAPEGARSEDPLRRGMLAEDQKARRRVLFPDTVVPDEPKFRSALESGKTPARAAKADADGPAISISAEAQVLVDRYQITKAELSVIRGSGRNDRILPADVATYLQGKGVQIQAAETPTVPVEAAQG